MVLIYVPQIFLVVQVLALVRDRKSRSRFRLGLYCALSCLLLIASLCAESLLVWCTSKTAVGASGDLDTILTIIQIGESLVLGILCISLPRRPDVFHNGRIVDRQYTVSVLSRYTFSWASALLKETAARKSFELDDLPDIDYSIRAQTLHERFAKVDKMAKLWHAIVFTHASALSTQWCLASLTSATQFMPQIALLKILQNLEARQDGRNITPQLWLWVVVIGASLAISSWLETWLIFVVSSKIGIPLYGQLSAVIYAKSLRRKDVKEPMKSNEHSHSNEDTGQRIGAEEDEQVEKSQRSTINLVGVDAKRVADFATFTHIFLGMVIKLALAIVILAHLIGWIPLLLGLLAGALLTPLNSIVTNAYSLAQGDLMKIRDYKMAVVTEAIQGSRATPPFSERDYESFVFSVRHANLELLLGIRQIKFGALEDHWERRIASIREKELQIQWRVFKHHAGLIAIWILGPIMLSAVSLVVYTLLHHDLSASVAFTTISVFGSIESMMGNVPELFTAFFDAGTSLRRIEAYLNLREVHDTSISASSISYENAVICWPSDEPQKYSFKLRNITLEFPNQGLSIVAGKTGSGKSLLLASILGESDILSGSMAKPRSPSLDKRRDELPPPTKDNWIIPSAIAFVAQIPWIENASIRQNVLFNLPYDHQRYGKVLYACALDKDMTILPDGDLTDVGASGINLSGGQRWRVSFARALYSRAGIMILDDIFSAVDAQVGRHLYEEGKQICAVVSYYIKIKLVSRGLVTLKMLQKVLRSWLPIEFSPTRLSGSTENSLTSRFPTALTGELGSGRTRILATHHVSLCLPRATYFVLLGNGTVQHADLVQNLGRSGHLVDALSPDVEQHGLEEKSPSVQNGNASQHITRPIRAKPQEKVTNIDGTAAPHEILLGKKFTLKEDRASGSVKLKVYTRYLMTNGGIIFWMVISVFLAGYVSFNIGRVSETGAWRGLGKAAQPAL